MPVLGHATDKSGGREKKPLSRAREADAPLLARDNQASLMTPIIYYQACQIASILCQKASRTGRASSFENGDSCEVRAIISAGPMRDAWVFDFEYAP
jgi:hypothetical protein